MAVSVNVVVLAGTIDADPVERPMPSGEECTEIRLSVPEPGRRLLPLPVVAWHAEVGKKWLKGRTPSRGTTLLTSPPRKLLDNSPVQGDTIRAIDCHLYG